jgi:hypothetical protein
MKNFLMVELEIESMNNVGMIDDIVVVHRN